MAQPSNNLSLALRIKAAVEGLQSLEQLADQIEAVGGDASKFRDEASQLSTELENLARKQHVVENFRAVSEQAEAAAASLNELKVKSADATASQDAIKRSLETSAAALSQAKERTAELSADLHRSTVSAKEAEAKYAELRQAAKGAGDGNGELADQVKAAKAELDAAKSTLAATSAALADAEKAERALEQAVDSDRTALERQGEVTNRLATQIAVAEAAVREKADALTQAGKAAEYAGINTSDLAAEEQRVAREMINARSAAAELTDEVTDNAKASKAVADAYEQLGIKSGASLQQAASSARSAYDTIKSSGTASARDVEAAFEAVARAELEAANAAGSAQLKMTSASLKAEASTHQQREAVERLTREVEESGEQAKRSEINFRSVLGSLAAFAGIQLGGQLVKDLIGLADQAKNVSARLQIAAGAGDLFVQAQKDVLDIALQTGTKLESTANLYGRLAQAIKAQGGNAADAAIATRAISEAFAVSGASAESADAAIVQLAQGLASGTLRGDELNSVLEQAPRLAQAFADSLGVSTGKLRELGAEGALTPQLLLDALKEQAPKIAAEFDKIPVTVGRAMTNLGTAITVAVGKLDDATGSTTTLGTAINDLATQLIEFAGDKGVQAAFAAVGDAVVVSFEQIAAAYYGIKTTLASVAAATAQASAAIALGLSKITFGETSKAFAEAADILQTRAEELRETAGESLAKTGEHLQSMGKRFADGVGHAADAVSGFGEQAEAIVPPADAASAALEGVGGAAEGSGNKLADLGKKTTSLAEDLAKAAQAIGSDYGLLSDGITDSARKAADGLSQLLEHGKLTAAGLRVAVAAAIDSAKTVQDLDLIKGAIERAYAAGKVSVDDLRAAVERVTAAQQTLSDEGGLAGERLSKAAQTLGVDVDRIGNRISAGGKQAVQAFGEIAQSGAVAVQQMGAVIDAAFAKLASQKDVQAFEAAITQAFGAGQISAEQYREALQRCKDMERELAVEAGKGITIATQGVKDLAAAYDARTAKEKDAAAAARESADETAAALQEQQQALDQYRKAIGGAETRQDLALLREQLNLAWQDGKLGAQEYQALLDQINSRTKEISDNLNGLTDFANAIGAWYDDINRSLHAMSGETAALFAKLEGGRPYTGTLDQIGQLEQRLASLRDNIAENQRYLILWTTTTLSQYMAKSAIHYSQAAAAFTEQQIAALKLQKQLEANSGQTDQLIAKAEQAYRNFRLLDGETLSNLRGAIDSARQKLVSLRESADDTLTSLREELAQATGDLVQAQQIRNQQRMEDLQAQLAQAQAVGDRQSIATLQQAIDALKRINDINLQNAKQQMTERQAPKPTTATSATPTTRATDKVEVTINIGGQRVVGEYAPADAARLVDALQHAQSISSF